MSGFFVEIIDALFSSKSITLQEENETAKLYIGKWIHQNKVFLHCVKLARIILARHYVQSVRIRSSTDPYFLTTGKHGPEKLRIRTLFTLLTEKPHSGIFYAVIYPELLFEFHRLLVNRNVKRVDKSHFNFSVLINNIHVCS